MEEKNNIAELCGTLGGKVRFSHKNKSGRYYTFPLELRRLSGVCDSVNIIAREELVNFTLSEEKQKISVIGELRSYNNKSGEGSRLVISVLAKKIELSDGEDRNDIMLIGSLCKEPNYRVTPMGREICDMMLAVNRKYGKSDYLPCIAWGRNASEAGEWESRSKVKLYGRLQSRKYIKVQDGESVEKTAFEVSVIQMEKV